MRITIKGQVTIPMEFREKLGLLPNTEVEFELDRDAVRIRKAANPGERSRGRLLVDRLRGRGTGTLTTDQILRLMRS